MRISVVSRTRFIWRMSNVSWTDFCENICQFKNRLLPWECLFQEQTSSETISVTWRSVFIRDYLSFPKQTLSGRMPVASRTYFFRENACLKNGFICENICRFKNRHHLVEYLSLQEQTSFVRMPVSRTDFIWDNIFFSHKSSFFIHLHTNGNMITLNTTRRDWNVGLNYFP